MNEKSEICIIFYVSAFYVFNYAVINYIHSRLLLLFDMRCFFFIFTDVFCLPILLLILFLLVIHVRIQFHKVWPRILIFVKYLNSSFMKSRIFMVEHKMRFVLNINGVYKAHTKSF